MGLGGYPAVGLKDARDRAAHRRQQAKLGNDPIKMRGTERREAVKTGNLLKNVAIAAFETRKAELKVTVKPAAGSLLLNFMCCQN